MQASQHVAMGTCTPYVTCKERLSNQVFGRKTETKIKTRKTMQKKEVEEEEKMLQRHAIEKHGVSRWCIDTRQGKARRNTMQ